MRILIIRRDNIGDLVCTTPLIRALRVRYPQARIYALVNSYNAPILDGHPDVDRIYSYTKAKHREGRQTLADVYLRRVITLWRLRRERVEYALIAGAHHLPRALRLARLVRPQHIIGFTEPGYRSVKHIDMGIPYTLPKPMHEVEDIFRLLAPLGIVGRPPTMLLRPSPAEVAFAGRALEQFGPVAGKTVVGFHISARKPSNRWPAERFVELINNIHHRHDAVSMLFWSPGSSENPWHPGDDDKAEAILAQCRGLRIIPYRTDHLNQLVGGLASCSHVICSDGGAMHIAAAVGANLVCLFGGTDPARWHPWRSRHVLLRPDSRRVEDISADDALQALEQLWDGKVASQ